MTHAERVALDPATGYAKPIPTLVPGQELDNIYFDGERDGNGGWKNRDPHPDQVRVTVELDAPDVAHYTDHFDLDVTLIRDRTMVTSTRHPNERLKQAVKALEGINKALTHIARTMPTTKQALHTAEPNNALIEKLLGQTGGGDDKPAENPADKPADEDNDSTADEDEKTADESDNEGGDNADNEGDDKTADSR